MKITIVAGETEAVAWYRLVAPASVLWEEGCHLEIDVIEKLPIIVNPDTRQITGFGNIETDVLVLQIPMLKWIANAIEGIQKRGVKVIVEVDDNYQALHPQHMSYFKVSPVHSPERNWKHLKDCCNVADLVTCSTPALAKVYAPHGRVAVLRNYVASYMLDVPKRASHNGKLTVGWAGAVGVHPNDLDVTRGGVASAIEEENARFLCIGGGNGVKEKLNLRDIEIAKWVDFELYPLLLSKFDVGIVPLADTKFNHGKSWLKGLEYAAVGTPFIASDVPEYRALKEYLEFPLAREKERDWRRGVRHYLMNEADRIAVAQANREAVREHLTIEDNAWRWAEAWESVAKVRALS